MNRIEINKKYRGYEYLVYATPMGHRCGYVKIPSKHYLYKKDYGEQLNIKFDDLKEQEVGKRNPITIFCSMNLKPEDNITMDLLFDVHGGITWSDWGKNNKFKKPGWWIGFDCAHSGDGKDVSIMDESHRKMNEEYSFSVLDGIARSKKYVERECKNLIEQIVNYFDKKDKE